MSCSSFAEIGFRYRRVFALAVQRHLDVSVAFDGKAAVLPQYFPFMTVRAHWLYWLSLERVSSYLGWG